LDLQLPMQSVPITTNVVSSNPTQAGVQIQHNVIKFVSDLSMVFSGYSGFLHHYNWPPRYNWNIVESGVKHHNLTPWNCNNTNHVSQCQHTNYCF